MRSVKVSVTVHYVYTILMHKLALLCIANCHSMRVATASSEVCSVLSPYKSDQRCIVCPSILIKETSVKLIGN